MKTVGSSLQSEQNKQGYVLQSGIFEWESWNDVKTVGDIILLSKKVEILQPAVVQQPVQAAQPAVPVCPRCGKPGTWIPQYKRYYCYTCKQYL